MTTNRQQTVQALSDLMAEEENKGAESGLAFEILSSLRNEALEDGPSCLTGLPHLKQAMLDYALDQYNARLAEQSASSRRPKM